MSYECGFDITDPYGLNYRPRKPKSSSSILRRLFRRFDGRCYWCNRICLIEVNSRDASNDNRATRDHLVPLSRGGGVIGAKNIVLSCFKCNNEKDNMTPDEYRQYLAGRSELRGGLELPNKPMYNKMSR